MYQSSIMQSMPTYKSQLSFPIRGNSALTSDTFFSLLSLLGISPTSSITHGTAAITAQSPPPTIFPPFDLQFSIGYSANFQHQMPIFAEVNSPTLSKPNSISHDAGLSENPLLSIDHMDEDDDHLVPMGDDDESSSSKLTRTQIMASNPIYGFVDGAEQGNVNRH
ncbi:hypothetical protein L208DRAFT_1378314 [Tricholoma matsutake]|nr:hypothetical protein L208DRAFT_1378314 [Tricholoma matsutake 945]